MIKIVQNDITTLKVDVIVNAANSSLSGGAGVDGAIHRKTGQGLKIELRKIRKEKYPNGLPEGEAVMTKGYELPAKHIIHTVGPVYDKNKDQSHVLMSCFRKSLDLAERAELESIAFPAISTGAYGYPVEDCAKAFKRVFDFYTFKNLKKVVLCLFSTEDKMIFKKVFE